MKEPAQHLLGCEIDRCREKLGNIEDRLIQLEGRGNNSIRLEFSVDTEFCYTSLIDAYYTAASNKDCSVI